MRERNKEREGEKKKKRECIVQRARRRTHESGTEGEAESYWHEIEKGGKNMVIGSEGKVKESWQQSE